MNAVRTLSVLILLCGIAVAAVKEPRVQNGTVVTVAADKLTIAEKGKQEVFTVPDTARVTINGKAGRLSDLKVSMAVVVMIDEAGKVLSVSTVDVDKT